jgi:hypothetical protein
MSQQELLRFVCQRLDALGIDYMLTGSVASSLQGEPRASHDIDIVIALPAPEIARFCQSFASPDLFLQQESVVDAVQTSSQFNMLHLAGGDKVDFWLLTSDPFDRSRFARKRVEMVFGTPIKVSAPEDTILAKLRWAKLMGGSDKQLQDVASIVDVRGATLDLDYLKRWLPILGVEDLWERIQAWP